MLNRFKIKNSSGDTIVEVMIVLAVLSLAFAISYSTATRALSGSRNAQEHSEALGVVNTQIEQLRVAYANSLSVPQDRPFCMKDAATVTSFASTSVISPDKASDNLSNSLYPTDCISGFYHTSIVYVPANPAGLPPTTEYFDIRVRWEGIGSQGRQQVENTYKIYPLSADVNSGTPIQSSPASMNVIVKIVPKLVTSGNPTPSCASAATNNIGGTQVTLNKLTAPTSSQNALTSSAGSSAFFANLTDFASYKASITALPTPSVPGNGTFENCSPSGSATYTANPGSTTNITDLKIRPKCVQKIGTTAPYTHYLYLGTYGDYIGTYSDTAAYAHYSYIWAWAHTGSDGRHPWAGQDYVFQDGNGVWHNYRYRANMGTTGGRFFEDWIWTMYTQYLGTYSDTPAYAHYTAAYAHYQNLGVYPDSYTYYACPV